MKTQHDSLSAEESLHIITQMIDQAKGNVKANSFYFLLWGWVITLTNLGIFVLLKLGYQHPYVLWLVVIPTWIYTMYKGYRSGSSGTNLTPISKVNIWIWIIYGITIFILVGFGKFINYQLNAVILIITAIPTIASGVILKFRPLIMGGILFWVFGALCFVVSYEYQSLLSAAALIGGYLIPGYLLKKA